MIFSKFDRLPFIAISIYICLILTTSAFGQRARLFTTDSELPNSLIYQIHQDSKGLIWIATEDGLCKYDGAKITTYKTDILLSNYVKLIFEDSQGRLFFGFFSGLQLYDHASDKFTTIPLLMANNQAFDAHLMTIEERKNGDILIGSSGPGAFLLNEDSSQLVANQIVDLTPGNLIRHLFEDENENLWVSTIDEGLFRINPKGQIISYSADENLGEVSSIMQTENGDLYAGSFKNGLFKYNSQKDQFYSIPYPSSFSIITMTQRKDGAILLGTDGNGIKHYDPKNNKITTLNLNISNLDLSQAKVHSILEDKSGNIWLGLYQKGVALIPAQENNFHYIGNRSVRNNLIGSKYITSVSKEKSDALWVGTDGNGIFRLDSLSANGNYQQSENFPSSPSTTLSLFIDSQEKVWAGSYAEGLSIFDRKRNRFRRFDELVEKDGKKVDYVTCLAEDSNEHLWVGTLGSGVFSIDLNTQEVTQYYSTFRNGTDGTAIHNNWISSLFISKDQKVYIGTYDGISYLDLKTGSFTRLNQKHPELAGKIVYTQYEDHFGHIWFGTSYGLISLNPKTNELITYTLEDGLPSNVICGIKPYGDKLWISTNYGISEFDTWKGTFVNYYYSDGLQGNEFGKGAAFQDSNNNLFFAGINGITYFNPKEIKGKHHDPEVYATGFYINNQSVNTATRSGDYQVIDKMVMDATHFDLSHDDNSFAIEFSAMEFSNPKRISYLYSMNNDNWETLPQGTNTVTFSNLRPGRYTFHVKAKDYNTYSQSKTLTIDIHPVWYLSRWAKITYFILLFLIVWGILFFIRQRYETQQKIKEHLQSKKINEAKLEFFINISHEIRTPISLIINPLKKLIKQDVDENRQREYFTMHRSAERILKLVNQLLDIRKIDKGQLKMTFQETEIIPFIQETGLLFDEQMHGKDLKFSINASQNIKTYIDPNHFDKVIQNLLSNAIKYTPPNGEINISLEMIETQDDSRQNCFSIEICDTGSGINEEDIERIFDRFYQSRKEAYNPQGTGIGLHLTRSIVELHHGSIQAMPNRSGIGTCFRVILPIGRGHLKDEEISTSNPTPLDRSRERYYIPISPLSVEHEVIKSKSKLNLLVVDDDDEIRNYLVHELAEDYHVSASMDGEQAYAEILKKSPDLIISDVVMPKMDGITLCKKVKHNVNINHIPVILLTAKAGEEDNLKGLDTGADAYIAKPFNIEILKKTTANLIKNRLLLKNNYNGNQLQEDKIREIELQSTDDILMQKIMGVINDNIDNAELNVELIASEIGFSRVHLYRKLKEITNQSARDLIKNTRLKQAGDLLAQKQISISEVAYATGFSTPAKFSTSFKEFYGVSPTKYVEQKKKENLA